MNFFETESRLIVTVLWASSYLGLGVFLIVLSNFLGGLVIRGLDQPSAPPATLRWFELTSPVCPLSSHKRKA